MYAVQHLVELRDVDVSRIRLYADDQLEVTGELLTVSKKLENHGEYHIRSISGIKRAVGYSLSRWPGQDWWSCLLYTSPSPRDKRQSRMPSSA